MHENDMFKMSVSLYEMTRVKLVQLVIKIMAACALLNVMRVQKSPRDRKYFKLSLLIKQTESLKMILLKDQYNSQFSQTRQIAAQIRELLKHHNYLFMISSANLAIISEPTVE